MLLPSIKQRVRESFDRAALTYDSAAIVQRRVCDRSRRTRHRCASTFSTPVAAPATDRGSCARAGQRRSSPASISLGHARAAARHDTDTCLTADIEELPFPENHFDLWWSSLAIQWCDNDKVFQEAARVLRNGGQLALSTLGPGTFQELREAFTRRRPAPSHPALQRARRRQIGPRARRIQVHRRGPRKTFGVLPRPEIPLLRSIRDIGAHNVGEGARSGMMGRSAWQQVDYLRNPSHAGRPAGQLRRHPLLRQPMNTLSAKKRAWFVTGTDTEVGKTFSCCALLR